MAETPVTDLEAKRFLADADAQLLELSIDTQRAEWVYSTYITPDTEALSAKAYTRLISTTVELAKKAVRFESPGIDPDLRRRSRLLRLSLSLVAPSGTGEGEELTRIVAALQGQYGKGRYTPRGKGESLDLQALEHILAHSRDPSELEEIWTGWHLVGRPMRVDFARYVELANRGAREVGFDDLGSMWRSKYDMPPDQFALEVERLWNEVRPLYLELHAYIRRKLVERYGPDRVPPAGLIPAHLLGNMWAQSWENLFPIVAPPTNGGSYDLTALLKAKTDDPKEIVRYAERFFTSVGFAPLPATFWDRSLFVRPRDREVICHASAWDLDFVDDLRIKMCIEISGDDFNTIHHELGHNYYQRAYNHLPFLYRDSANDGFHEAVGDAIGLSMTPEYLVKVGLLDQAPDARGDIGLLLHRALEKVAFLPFGLLIDEWRWKVFSGEVLPSEYNSSWWAMRAQYQGVAPPSARSEADFDPGAKYHVSANVPYMRYFLAHLLQFQFHQAFARTIGWKGPLHRCSIYGHPEAGERLISMLAMGQSRPWPDALSVITGGERQMEVSALREYFAPLESWLKEQNRGHPVGW